MEVKSFMTKSWRRDLGAYTCRTTWSENTRLPIRSGCGNTYSPPPVVRLTFPQGFNADIPGSRLVLRCSMKAAIREARSLSQPAVIPFGGRLPRICWKLAMIFGLSGDYSVMGI